MIDDTYMIPNDKFELYYPDLIKRDNQTFAQMPFTQLIKMIKYSEECIGIKTIEQGESYTSKASFLDSDDIPVCEKNSDIKCQFSRKRMGRGLYKSKDGKCINVDLNALANIMRKAFPLLATNINFESITTIHNAYTVLN